MAISKSRAPRPASDPLTEFFEDPASRRLSTAEFVSHGVTKVSERHLEELQPQLATLGERIAKVQDSPRLQARLWLMVRLLKETNSAPELAAQARQEFAFALAYFLHGSDRIPDSTPEYGLLDDALVVEAVLQRNEAALRAHAARSGRTLPDEL